MVALPEESQGLLEPLGPELLYTGLGKINAAAMLSRATAGLMQGMAVFSMPGSSAACRLAMEKLILPQLGHVAGLARPGRQGGHGNGMRGSS